MTCIQSVRNIVHFRPGCQK